MLSSVHAGESSGAGRSRSGAPSSGGAAANASSVTFTADAGGRPRTCRSPDALSLSFVATTNNGRRQYHVSYDVAPESDDITAVAVAGADVINTAAVT